jgi:hypothetical protein
VPQIGINVNSDGAIVLNQATADFTGIVDYAFFAASAVTVTLKDEAGTVFGIYGLVAGSLNAVVPPIGFGGERCTAKGDIILGLSSGVVVTGHLSYAIKGK